MAEGNFDLPDNRQHPGLRVSDADRHAVAEVLRIAAGEGRLDIDELDQRLEAAYVAKTYAQLAPLTADLPASPSAPAVLSAPGLTSAAQPRNSTAICSTARQQGVWVLGREYRALAVLGEVHLDLRQAQFTCRETLIVANAVMGSIAITVGAHTIVHLEGSGVAFARSRIKHEPTPHSPVIYIRGFSMMGSVRVKRKGPPTNRFLGLTAR